MMQSALALALRAPHHCAPNPTVGAVIGHAGQIFARAITAPGGRPHAETIALAQAGPRARGATLAVTLEPCAHHGQTPPCVEAIIAAGIARVIIGCNDPDPRTNGASIATLRAAKVEVITDCCAEQARALHAGFIHRVTREIPRITLKIASTWDAKIATAFSESKWLTGEPARAYGHLLRSQHDAILTGIDTVLMDDPMLNCRLPGLEQKSPVRIVLDSNFRFHTELRMAQTARQLPTIIFTLAHSLHEQAEKAEQLRALSVEIIPIEGTGGRIDLPALLRAAAQRGINDLMVEAGKRLSTAFLQHDLVDRIAWFRGGLMFGESGISAIAMLKPMPLAQVARWKVTQTRECGNDRFEMIIKA